MVSEKEFSVIRNKVMTMRTAFLHNISNDKQPLNPVVANAIDVEEDGHLWMLVNSRMKKWENRCNIPVKLDFIPDDCHISLSGIGHITELEKIPPHLKEKAKKAKSIVKMKIYYGEYLPLTQLKEDSKLPSTGDFFSRLSSNIAGRTQKRFLFFR